MRVYVKYTSIDKSGILHMIFISVPINKLSSYLINRHNLVYKILYKFV